MALTPFAKALVVGVPIIIAVIAANYYLNHGDTGQVSSVPTADGKMVEFKEGGGDAGTTNTALPSTEPATLQTPQIRMDVLAWNAQMGLALANGGADTTKGSLMEKEGINLHIVRVDDDYSKMKEGLVACANELHGGSTDCSSGYQFVTIMGDGGPFFLAGLNDQLAKFGPEYTAEVVGGFGRSYGEDAFMGPPACKADPAACKGLLVSGVLMDGDWNLAQYWAKNNGICNNPDVTTYDPECLNWMGFSMFTDADASYIAGTCEERPVVNKGKKTGDRQQVCVGATVTWTPGDVTVTKTKGGLVKLLSTLENSSQMPNALVGIKKWNKDHAKEVTGILRAGLAGGAQIKADTTGAALMAAGAASAQIYGAEDAAYWVRYYEGVKEQDATGKLMVPLGGSRVFSMADASRFFGLDTGAANAFAATYTLFGDIAKQQYPKDLPSYPPVGAILNTTYLKAAGASMGAVEKGTADVPSYQDTGKAPRVIASRSWNVTFVSGSDAIAPEAGATLKELSDTLVVSEGAKVTITGHTDNTGNPDGNLILSKARAQSVKLWLAKNAPANFPDMRTTVDGKGQNEPVALNTTSSGRAQNRRVDIVLSQ